MILIADSGSTKTHWCVCDAEKTVQHIYTNGINPFYQSEEEISSEIKSALLPALQKNEFEAVYFYGAGCIFDKIEVVKQAIQQTIFVKNIIEVNSDMLAAARALCGNEKGIACILGTGSNSCYYNGKVIETNVAPLGFILGDEGSGAVLGKLFVSDLLKNQLSQGLKELFLEKYQLTVPDIMDRAYRKPFPNRFLAGFTPFLIENMDDGSIYTLVLNSFKSFFKRNVMQYAQYKDVPVHFTGSVAFHFQKILKQAANEMEISLGNITKGPMEGLVLYHSNKQQNTDY